MTYDDIRLQTFDRTGYGAAPAATVVTRVGRYVNRWHRKVLTMPGMRSLRRVEPTLASVANQIRYGIALSELYYVTERTNDRRLAKRTEDWWRLHYPDPTAQTGTPKAWVPLGFTRVHTRPSDPSEIFVDSTDGADTTQTAHLEVIRSTGYRDSLSVQLTGTTAVSFNTAITDIIDIVDFYLTAPAAGTVTLHEDASGGTELSRLLIGTTYPRFLAFALAPTPSAVVTYFLSGLAPIVDMTIASDRPLLDDDYHDILVDGAVREEFAAFGGKARQSDVVQLDRDIAQRMAELRMHVFMQQQQGEGEGIARPRSFEETIRLPLT